jgi:hypothetical protein
MAWAEARAGAGDEADQARGRLAGFRRELGEAAYVAAAGRGAAMDDDEIVRYAVGEFQRVAALLAEPGAPAPPAPPGPASGPHATTTTPPRPA